MHHYERFSNSDASDLALLFSEVCSSNREIIDSLYDRHSKAGIEQHSEYLRLNERFIADFIAKTQSKRRAAINKLLKSHKLEDVAYFTIMCVIAVKQANRLFELCGDYPAAVSPGGSYRNSTASAFHMMRKLSISSNDYDWPAGDLLNVGIECFNEEDEALYKEAFEIMKNL